MKILFINKYDITGGAGIVATRLHKELERSFNTLNYFLVGIKRSQNTNVFETRKKGFQNNAERIWNYVSNQLGMQYQAFPFSTKTILKKTTEIKPDIINIHNIHGGYFKISLLPELSGMAPVVWTLHDMWAFTANAAHTFGDESWKKMRKGKYESGSFPQIGLNSGNWLIKRKKKIYEQSDLKIVAPSKWLCSLAGESPLLGKNKIYHIPNGVDLNLFRPLEKSFVRKKTGIPADAKVLLFSAENLVDSPFKGGNELKEILKKINSALNEKIYLIALGKGDLGELKLLENFKIIEPGYIYEEKVIVEFLSAADIYIYPTKADNLPNSLIEASACGLPSVSSDIGGCGEIIRNEYNGFLVPSGNPESFSQKVLILLSDENMRRQYSENCRTLAEKEYSLKAMAEGYYNLFKKLADGSDA